MKWCERFVVGGMEYSFRQWKDQVIRLKMRARYTRIIKKNQIGSCIKVAFMRWKSYHHQEEKKVLEKKVWKATCELESETEKNQIQKKIHMKQCQKIIDETEPIRAKVPTLDAKKETILKLLTDKNQKKHWVPYL